MTKDRNIVFGAHTDHDMS